MSQEMETQLLHSLAGLVQKIGQDCKVCIVFIHTVPTQKTKGNPGCITHISLKSSLFEQYSPFTLVSPLS
jgi:hypothetical protein